MRRGWIALAAGAALWVGGCSGGEAPPKAAAPAAPAGEASAFAGLEAEILVPKCARAGCHGGDGAAGGLDLSRGKAHADLVGVAASRRPDRLLVSPGDPEGSYLMQRLVAGGDSPRMPLAAAPLTDAEVEAIRAWIRDGAKE